MLDKIPFRWPIFNRQTIIDSEELTSLELAGRTAEKVNEAIDEINAGIASIAGKEDSENITTNRKLSPTGNFTGSWFGISNPALADPGIAGSVIALQADNTQRAINIKQPPYNATGNGVTDDSAAIQAAIDAGNIIFFPPGIYHVGTTLKYNKDDLLLIGKDATISGDVNLLQFKDYEDFSGNALMKNIKVEGITFKQETLGFNEDARLLVIGGVDGFTVDNCQFIGWNGDAILIDLVYQLASTTVFVNNVTTNITIRNCLFDGVNNDNRQAISLLQCTNVLIENNDFKNTTKSTMPGAIDIEPWQNQAGLKLFENITIKHNHFTNITGFGGAVHCVLPGQNTFDYPVRNIKVLENTFEQCDIIFYFNQENEYTTVPYDVDWISNDVLIENNIVLDKGKFIFYGMKGLTFNKNIFGELNGESVIGATNFTAEPDLNRFCRNVLFTGNRFNEINGSIVLGDLESINFSDNIFAASDAYATTGASLIRHLPHGGVSKDIVNFIFKFNIVRNMGSTTRIDLFYEANYSWVYTKSVFLNNFLDTGITEFAQV